MCVLCVTIISSSISFYVSISISAESICPLTVVSQPKDTKSEPGKKVCFTIKTFPASATYQWYFEEVKITFEDKDYEGFTTERLLLKKFLPKHKGRYRCIATNGIGHSVISNNAVLKSRKLFLF